MGRNSSGNRGTKDGGGDYKGKITNVGPLVEMTDPQMYKATKQAISRYHAVLGVRQCEVKLADFPGAYGVHVTSGDGKSKAVYLNRSHFNQEQRELQATTQQTTQVAGVPTPTSRLLTLSHMSWHTLHGMSICLEPIKGRPARKSALFIVHG